MLWSAVRYQYGPPAMVVGVTAGVQALAWLGGGEHTNSWSLVGSQASWGMVAAVVLYAFASLKVPAPTFTGPPPPHGGASPRYSANGVAFYAVSLALCLALLLVFPSSAVYVYRSHPQFLASCNLLALVFCGYLLWAGKTRPQAREDLPPRPLAYEFYRGMELHPRLLGVDVKQLTNCRFGLLLWQGLVVVFFVASWRLHGSFNCPHFVCVLLQTVYLAKFYWWETGYFNTLDITLDRAGYYICWGCIVFVPGFYTFTSFYFVANPPEISNSGACLCLFLGLLAIALNYRVDWEKEYFRYHNGKCVIWMKPATYVKATYTDVHGKQKTSLLLTSGFWGVSRHLNYVFELLLALSWSLPGWGLGFLPFSYFAFLCILLVHRIFRDEEKCIMKYGKYWEEYCKAVPYRLIPYIF